MLKFYSPLIVVFMTLWLGCSGAVPDSKTQVDQSTDQEGKRSQDKAFAKVEAYIMAKCQYGAQAMETLISLKNKGGDAVNLEVKFIGLLDEKGRPASDMSDAEIASARVQACVMMGDESKWLDFARCVYKEDLWRIMPDGWQQCAQLAKVNVSVVQKCIDSGEGDIELLKMYASSMTRRIESSPTIFLNDEQLPPGMSLKDMMASICFDDDKEEAPEKLCDEVEPLPQISATILFDSRCVEETCNPMNALVQLVQIFPGLKIEELDYVTAEGKKLFESIGKNNPASKYLPLIVFDSLPDEKKGLIRPDFLTQFGDKYVIDISQGWDPTAEICDNKTDDNADGVVDCDDDTCAKKLACRPPQKRRLDLFIMSQCPFGVSMIKPVAAALNHFGNDRKQIDLHFQFIGGEVGGELQSMHGEEEVAEDLRMICVQELYKKNYLFMDYMKCRVESKMTGDWKSCVSKKMNARRIKKCAEGDQGKALLKASFEMAEQLKIGGSPSWLLNGHIEMEGRAANTIVEAFCQHNDSKACKKEVAEQPSEASSDMELKCN